MPTAESINAPQTGKVEFFKPDALPSRRQPTDFDLAYKWLRGSLPVHRSEAYRKMVNKRPCIVCGAPPPSEAHHVLSGRFGGKTTDLACVPLCSIHHRQTEEDPAFMRQCLQYLVKFHIQLLAEIYAKVDK